MNEYLLPK
nr:RecName: Full=Cytochrome P450-like protein [Cycas revoluta]